MYMCTNLHACEFTCADTYGCEAWISGTTYDWSVQQCWSIWRWSIRRGGWCMRRAAINDTWELACWATIGFIVSISIFNLAMYSASWASVVNMTKRCVCAGSTNVTSLIEFVSTNYHLLSHDHTHVVAWTPVWCSQFRVSDFVSPLFYFPPVTSMQVIVVDWQIRSITSVINRGHVTCNCILPCHLVDCLGLGCTFYSQFLMQ